MLRFLGSDLTFADLTESVQLCVWNTNDKRDALNVTCEAVEAGVHLDKGMQAVPVTFGWCWKVHRYSSDAPAQSPLSTFFQSHAEAKEQVVLNSPAFIQNCVFGWTRLKPGTKA